MPYGFDSLPMGAYQFALYNDNKDGTYTKIEDSGTVKEVSIDWSDHTDMTSHITCTGSSIGSLTLPTITECVTNMNSTTLAKQVFSSMEPIEKIVDPKKHCCILDMIILNSAIPQVTDVTVYNNCVVKVMFSDGSFTKSVCSPNDHFDLDVGITICLIKRMLGKDAQDGNRKYNDIIRKIHKIMTNNAQEAINEQNRKAAERNKKRKIELKKAAKAAKARQEQLDIQKQAYLEALRAYDAEGDETT